MGLVSFIANIYFCRVGIYAYFEVDSKSTIDFWHFVPSSKNNPKIGHKIRNEDPNVHFVFYGLSNTLFL